ncbi:MAG: farnesyl-diphosphate farnesyltransferase [Nitrospinota bacterium]|nr:MAG: farnesyl-diphosphate farnesyltransferase [Nitrospinota bacterium]
MESRLTDKQAIPAERRLLQSLPSLFAMLEGLAAVDRTSVQKVVITLTQGMEIDLTTFPAEDSGQIGVLKDEEALERYIYYVAGCVGEFWTTLLVTHTPALKHWQVPQMSAIGVRFGKALQLTNVLRDVPRDLRIGRCYLPERDLARLGVTPEALLDPASGIHIRPLLFQYIRKTLDYYRAAEGYLLAIPRRCLRLRLAVLWPILIGLGTLHVLGKNEAWLDPSQPSKVGRRWVYRILLLSLPVVWSDRLLRTWIGHWRRRVEAVLTEK